MTQALRSPNGLLAWGGDLHPQRLLAAYRAGIFPWYSAGQPILWWSPAPRCVLYPERVYLSKRTRRRYNSGRFELRADSDFAAVIEACAEPREFDAGTWITPEMQAAYLQLHQAGHAHSVEVWRGEKLLGGIYGLACGAVFFGESMFSRETDASKIALIGLCRLLQEWNFALLDCQVSNPHLLSMGAELVSRETFQEALETTDPPAQGTGSWTKAARFDERW